MSEKTAEEIKTWHHYFGVKCNNRAWDLATQPERTADEDAELLDCAHTSAFHWSHIGTELNHMRATILLAEVHAQLGMANSAMNYAQTMYAFYTNRETDDWEIALMHAVMAKAAHAAGNHDLYLKEYRLAEVALDQISEKKERDVIQPTFDLIPKPQGA